MSALVWHELSVGTASMCGLMLALWLIHLPLRNAAIVDAGWAGGLALLGAIYAVTGGGYMVRALLVGGMAVLWGLRLAIYLLFTRVIGQPEEGRYVQLRREWGGNLPLKFLLFFQFQALLCVFLATPFLIAALNSRPELSAFEYAGAVCSIGLWKYSRHPNYFFEWLIWVAFAVFALGSPHGSFALLCPALMLFFLFRVTGIPATEAQALRSKGDAYRQYQRSTSAFVPWFPRG